MLPDLNISPPAMGLETDNPVEIRMIGNTDGTEKLAIKLRIFNYLLLMELNNYRIEKIEKC